MKNLSYLFAVVCLICITITSSLPCSLAGRPIAAADADRVVAATSFEPADLDSSVTATSFIEDEVHQRSTAAEVEGEDMSVHPCFSTLAEAEAEGRTDDTEDGDSPLVEVDCRRMLARLDYSGPRPNKNPKCSRTTRC